MDIPCHKENPYTPTHASGPSLMIISKLTTKAQTTIPQPVRAALHLKPGDELLYEIDDQRVIITKAKSSGKTDDPFRTFHEWGCAADSKGYAKL
jgi:antitoxin PrlF